MRESPLPRAFSQLVCERHYTTQVSGSIVNQRQPGLMLGFACSGLIVGGGAKLLCSFRADDGTLD